VQRNTQAETYMRMLFADHSGYVAVASKNGQAGAWSEHVFSWPDDRDLILSWAESNRTGDVFICPALRRTRSRSKNDGAHLQWLWADVDWQDVPTERRDDVKRRIAKTSTFTVASGSGDNVHVYVKLPKPVPLDMWRRLNTGLRVYLDADAKHTDNALLRLPGTTNHKPGGGHVAMGDAGTRVVNPSTLLKHPAWQNLVIADDRGANDGTYDTVDVTHLWRGEIKRRCSMDVDEAEGRYGTRHGAVFQVASWLSRKGLTADQIHTLMAEFPAGLDKEDEERGYSLHVDIARCLSAQPTVEALEVVDDVFEIVENDDPDDTLLAAARKRMRNLDIERLARQMDAQRMFTPPPGDVSYTWLERRAMPRPPVQFAVDGICAIGQNVTITGQYKAGKTLLALNLVRSLVDGVPFLGEFKVGVGGGGSARVGLWSMEMSQTDLDTYIDPLAIGDDGAGRLAVLNGRGFGVNILTDVGKQWAVNWLKQWGCSVWVIDSHARMCRMAGVDENENGPVLGLLHRLDEIKEAAGIGELYYLVHTGRTEMAEGKERARGATVIDDWADARWVLTRQGAVRFLAVEGRSVRDMTARSLEFDDTTGAMLLGNRDPISAKVDGLTALVVSIITDHPGEYNARALRSVIRERSAGSSHDRIKRGIEEGITLGVIRVLDGPRGEKRYWPVDLGDASDQAESTVPHCAALRGTVKPAGSATPHAVNPRGLTDMQSRAEGRVKRDRQKRKR
jgi:hypothetical protein